MSRQFLNHGRRHLKSDPVPYDWIYVGSGSPAPSFQNSWANSGGSKVPLRYRFIVGEDPTNNQPALEIQGSVTGGTSGTTIFALPITLDYDLHLAASDDGGSFVVFTVKQSGDVVYGFA